MLGVAMLNHGWWMFGTLLGTAIGTQATSSLVGLDFSLAALFAVLAVEQWRASKRAAPILTAAIAYVAALLVVPAQALLVSIGLSLLVGLALCRSPDAKGAQ